MKLVNHYEVWARKPIVLEFTPEEADSIVFMLNNYEGLLNQRIEYVHCSLRALLISGGARA